VRIGYGKQALTDCIGRVIWEPQCERFELLAVDADSRLAVVFAFWTDNVEESVLHNLGGRSFVDLHPPLAAKRSDGGEGGGAFALDEANVVEEVVWVDAVFGERLAIL
jgi:hypothetical protein